MLSYKKPKGITMELDYVLGARRLGAALIEMSLKDLEKPHGFNLSKIERREAAFQWFKDRSDKPFGYLWCISVSNQNGALINHAVNYLYYEEGKLSKLKYKNL